MKEIIGPIIPLTLIAVVAVAASGEIGYRRGWYGAIDEEVQRVCWFNNNNQERKAAGVHIDLVQVDGREYYCRKENR